EVSRRLLQLLAPGGEQKRFEKLRIFEFSESRIKDIFQPRLAQRAAERAIRPDNPRTEHVVAGRARDHRKSRHRRQASVEDGRCVQKVRARSSRERLQYAEIFRKSDAA